MKYHKTWSKFIHQKTTHETLPCCHFHRCEDFAKISTPSCSRPAMGLCYLFLCWRGGDRDGLSGGLVGKLGDLSRFHVRKLYDLYKSNHFFLPYTCYTHHQSKYHQNITQFRKNHPKGGQVSISSNIPISSIQISWFFFSGRPSMPKNPRTKF